MANTKTIKLTKEQIRELVKQSTERFLERSELVDEYNLAKVRKDED